MFTLKLDENALKDLEILKQDHSKARILKDVVKALNHMQENLRYPSLNTHEYKGFKGPNGEKVFEDYAQQKTAGAYRIFWHYGPEQNTITIMAIIAHP